MPEIDVLDSGWRITPPAGKNVVVTLSGGGKFQVAGGDCELQVGDTEDETYGGDVSGDSAGDGVRVVSADGNKHFAHAVYADDGGKELAAGWVSTIFGSMKNYTAVTPSCNLSAFGVTGQMHAGASIASIGNIGGVYGVFETVTGVTLGCNVMGGLFGFNIPSGAVLSAGNIACGILISGNLSGTMTVDSAAIFIQNPTGSFDYFAILSQNAQASKCGGDLDATVGDTPLGHVKVRLGGTAGFINVYSDKN